MRHLLLTAVLGLAMTAPQAQATEKAMETALDVDGECLSIAEADLSGCRCQGLYFESKFGRDEGAAALHLVARSYVSEPRIAASALYDRFGAERLNSVAQRILETRGEVMAYCPFSAPSLD
ncbi:hypothetical protein AAII07_55935 [Microvirga sp. 0TCS3.31]